MKYFTRLFLPFFTAFCVMLPQSAYAAVAFSVVRQATSVSSGVSNGKAIIQVAQPYTLTQAGNNTTLQAANQFALTSGANSSGSLIAQAALGIGSLAVGVISSPVFGAAITALTIGMAGYTLYQQIKASGVIVNADGTAIHQQTWLSNAGLVCISGGTTYIDGAIYTNSTGVSLLTVSTSTAPSIVVQGVTFPNRTACVSGNQALYNTAYQAPKSSPATKDDLITAIDIATANPASSADGVALAQSKGINPLSYVPTTTPNLAPNPYTVTLPDGTVVTITPPSTLGGQDAISPAPSSTTTVAPPATTTTQAPAVTFPTDYARQGEAAAAVAPVTNAVNGVKDAVTVTASPDLPDTTDSDIQKLGTPPTIPTFDDAGLNGVIPLPFSPDTCAPTTYNYRGVPYTIDLCPYHAQWHGYINFMFGFMGAIMTLRVLFAKEDA
jgi:hypothetical protein